MSTGMAKFNGECTDPVTGCQHLGNGYRAYSPTQIRFASPDSLSPFGMGGLNTYTYCAGDAVNQADPSAHELANGTGNWSGYHGDTRQRI